MSVSFSCPACGRELAAPDNAFGVAGNCRFCGAAIIAPSAPGEPARVQQPGPERDATFAGTPAATPGLYAEGGSPPGVPCIHPPTGELDLGAIIGEAWNTVTANWGIFAAACLVTQFLPGFVQQVVQLPMQFLPAIVGDDHTAANALVMVACLLASLAISIAAVPL